MIDSRRLLASVLQSLENVGVFVRFVKSLKIELLNVDRIGRFDK